MKKIGGNLYLAQVQHAKRFSYSKQLNRRSIRAQQEAVQFYGHALFAAKITQGQESVRLTIQRFADRISGETHARFAAYAQLNAGPSQSRGSGGLDLTV
jgi:hypothetical protein